MRKRRSTILEKVPAAIKKIETKGDDVEALTKPEITSILLKVYDVFVDPNKSSNNKRKIVRELKDKIKKDTLRSSKHITQLLRVMLDLMPVHLMLLLLLLLTLILVRVAPK